MNARRRSLIALLLLPLALVLAFGTAGLASASRDGSSTVPAKMPTITISNFSYKVPASVQPGAKIKVVNKDNVAHTVTADNGSFDIRVEGGAKGTFKAPKKAGDYSFVCTIHSSMKGTLTVAK